METAIIIAKIISVLLGLAIIIIGYHFLPTRKTKLFFIGTIICFTSSSLFYASEAPEFTWYDHIILYFGIIFFIVFNAHLLSLYENLTDDVKKNQKNISPIKISEKNFISIPLFVQISSFTEYLTQQGIQHVIAVLLGLFFIFFIRAKMAVTDFKGKYYPALWFQLSIFFVFVGHISALFIESQKVSSILEEPFEIIEFLFLYTGLIFIAIGMSKLPKFKS